MLHLANAFHERKNGGRPTLKTTSFVKVLVMGLQKGGLPDIRYDEYACGIHSGRGEEGEAVTLRGVFSVLLVGAIWAAALGS
jgi:hypothetical protein